MNKITKTTKKNIPNIYGAKKNDNEKCTCNFCKEEYIEINKGPIDDWIQSYSCCQWRYYKFTAHDDTDIFLCDNSTD